MSLIGFLVLICVIAILLWVVNTYVSVPVIFKYIFNGAALLILLIILLSLAGIDLLGVRVGK